MPRERDLLVEFAVDRAATREEQDAIARALADAAAPGGGVRGAWWHAGVGEAVAEAEGERQGPSRRSGSGAAS